MITKTYLDGRLKQLEENLKKRIDTKDNRQTQGLEEEIKGLKNILELVEERVAENRDILDNYLREHNGLKAELEELKLKISKSKEDIEKKDDVGIEKKEGDTITSDF
ncbi:MAG: hypothetical protein KAQ64_02365 [Candidatus Pacebacteria bacterium]|nr:hypothetical protein [Candidatus Paceibacterota bacterium]